MTLIRNLQCKQCGALLTAGDRTIGKCSNGHELPDEDWKGGTKTEPEMELVAVKEVVKELTAKLQLLVEWVDSKGLLEDHCFTFPDGDVWKAQDELVFFQIKEDGCGFFVDPQEIAVRLQEQSLPAGWYWMGIDNNPQGPFNTEGEARDDHFSHV